jgi:Holliday junction resolvase
MSVHSRDKGARGEREVAAILREHGFDAIRDGRLESDVKHAIPGVHIEVKRTERLRLREACEQAERDAPPGAIPIVVHRGNREPWRATMRLEDLLALLSLRDLDMAGPNVA